MRVQTKRHKTIEESKRFVLRVRDKKAQVMESLHKYNEIMEVEGLLKNLPWEIKNAKETAEDARKGFIEIQPQLEEKSVACNRLKEELDLKGKKLLSLKAETTEFKSKVQRQEQKIADIYGLQKKIAQLKDEKASIDSIIKGLTPEIRAFNSEIPSLQSKLATDMMVLSSLEAEKHRLDNETETLSVKLKNLGDFDAQQNDLAKVVAENNETSRRISQIESTLCQNNKLKAEITSDINNINEEVKKLSKTVADLRNKADSLSKTVIARDEVDKLQTQLNTITKDRDGLIESTARLGKDVEDQMEKKGEIIKQVESARAGLEAMNNECNSFMQKVDLYTKDPDQLDTLKNRITELEKIVAEYVKNNETAHEQLTRLNNAVSIINTELSGYREALGQIGRLLNVF